jgi:hypothetical protein
MQKPSISIIKKLGLVIACVAIGAIGWFVASSIRGVEDGINGEGIGFSVPLVAASEVSSAGMGVLNTQAGLSAHMKLSPMSDLSTLADAFDSLSFAGEGYIVGTIDVSVGGPYTGGVEILLYADTGGSVVAFQSAHAPSPMGVVDWGNDCPKGNSSCNSPLATTLLHKGLAFVTDELGGSAPVNPSFYHWQYPEAEQVLILADMVKSGKDDMQVYIPATATVYESTIGAFGGIGNSSAFYANWNTSLTFTNPSTVTLNGEVIKTSSEHFWWTATDKVLATDTVNEFSVDSPIPSNINLGTVAGLAVMVVYSR